MEEEQENYQQVVADIVSIVRSDVETDNSSKVVKNNLWKKEVKNVDEIVSRYYIRATVADEAGVLSGISSVFGKYKVSLRSVIQKEVNKNESKVTLVLVTHKCTEEQLNNSINNLKELSSVNSIDNVIRIEDFE